MVTVPEVLWLSVCPRRTRNGFSLRSRELDLERDRSRPCWSGNGIGWVTHDVDEGRVAACLTRRHDCACGGRLGGATASDTLIVNW